MRPEQIQNLFIRVPSRLKILIAQAALKTSPQKVLSAKKKLFASPDGLYQEHRLDVGC
jgi:hypothetical protein